MAIQGIFRGIKDTRTPLYATSTSFLSLHWTGISTLFVIMILNLY
jgi:Na+-driven multidrug efflux pump